MCGPMTQCPPCKQETRDRRDRDSSQMRIGNIYLGDSTAQSLMFGEERGEVGDSAESFEGINNGNISMC